MVYGEEERNLCSVFSIKLRRSSYANNTKGCDHHTYECPFNCQLGGVARQELLQQGKGKPEQIMYYIGPLLDQLPAYAKFF